MKRFVYILIPVLFCASAYSQNNTDKKITQADQLLEKAQELTDRAQYDSAKVVSKEAYALAKKTNYKHGEGSAYTQLADIAYQEGDYPAMKQYDSLARNIAVQTKDTSLLAVASEIQGLYLMDNDDKAGATRLFKEALNLKYEKEQSSDAARIYVNLGILSSNDKDVATWWLLKGIRLYEKMNDEGGMAHAYNNYATHLFSLERHKEALEYAKKSLQLREKTKDDYGLMYSYANISQLYSSLDSVKQALVYQMKSVQKAEQIGSDKLKAQSYVGLSLIYSKMKEKRLAFEYEMKAIKLLEKSGNTEMLSHRYIALAMHYDGAGDSASAIKYFTLSATMAKQYNYKETERDAYFHTTIFYKERKDFYHAYEYLKKYYAARDEILDREKEGTIAELETKYQTEKKEEQIKRLSSEKLIQDLRLERQGILRNILIGGTLLLIVLGYILFNRYQIKKKLEQKTVMLRERSRISAELHDEVGSTLSTINILSHSARMKIATDTERSAGLLEKINANSQRMMDAMSDIVWSINPENDELGRICVRMKEYASETLENRNIDYSFKISDELLALKLSPELRKDMYLVFKEAVNNVAKYSKAVNASIALTRMNGGLQMQIKDDGQGFDTEQVGSGNGVVNMRKRAEGHGGTLDIKSKEGTGTEITVLLPIA